jgi:hypothetical protein
MKRIIVLFALLIVPVAAQKPPAPRVVIFTAYAQGYESGQRRTWFHNALTHTTDWAAGHAPIPDHRQWWDDIRASGIACAEIVDHEPHHATIRALSLGACGLRV